MEKIEDSGVAELNKIGEQIKESQCETRLRQIESQIGTMQSSAKLVVNGVIEDLLGMLPKWNPGGEEQMKHVGTVLDLLMRISVNVFSFWDGIQENKAQEHLESVDGYNVLFNLYQTYSAVEFKEKLSIILAMFHTYRVLPSKMKEIVGVLRNSLVECIAQKSDELKRLFYVLSGIASLARQTEEANGRLLYSVGIIELMFGLFVHKDLDICRFSCRAVMNFMMVVKSKEVRRDLIAVGLLKHIASAFEMICDESYIPKYFPMSCIAGEGSVALSYYICMWFLGVVLCDIVETCEAAEWKAAAVEGHLGEALLKTVGVVYRHCPMSAEKKKIAKTFHEKTTVALLGQVIKTLGALAVETALFENDSFFEVCKGVIENCRVLDDDSSVLRGKTVFMGRVFETCLEMDALHEVSMILECVWRSGGGNEIIAKRAGELRRMLVSETKKEMEIETEQKPKEEVEAESVGKQMGSSSFTSSSSSCSPAAATGNSDERIDDDASADTAVTAVLSGIGC